MNFERLTTPWWTLRVALGASAFLAGLDKFFNLLANWTVYLSPIVAQMLPLSRRLSCTSLAWSRCWLEWVISRRLHPVGGYVAAVWLLGIALNLVTTGHYFDVAVRDVAMAVAAFTLARLTEAGVGAESRDHVREGTFIGHRAKVSA